MPLRKELKGKAKTAATVDSDMRVKVKQGYHLVSIPQYLVESPFQAAAIMIAGKHRWVFLYISVNSDRNKRTLALGTRTYNVRM